MGQECTTGEASIYHEDFVASLFEMFGDSIHTLRSYSVKAGCRVPVGPYRFIFHAIAVLVYDQPQHSMHTITF